MLQVPVRSISYTIISPKVAESKSRCHSFPLASLVFLLVSPSLFILYFYFCIFYLLKIINIFKGGYERLNVLRNSYKP